MQELVVISGKGGTGKTSLAASLAILAGNAVLADCDVDAADLHLVLSTINIEKHEFKAGYEARINQPNCNKCGHCLDLCRFDAVKPINNNSGPGGYEIDPLSCEGCGVCVRFCPQKTIVFTEQICGEWFISETRSGPMVHARLGIAAENSGKLVSIVRDNARQIAIKNKNPLIIIDGPPGIGCPVIASITGASLVLVVVEPTVSGLHDMKRVLSLTQHFSIPACVCVNKWDLNIENTERIELTASKNGARLVGRIRYDPDVTKAQLLKKTVVETRASAAEDIKRMWNVMNLNNY